MAHLIYAAEMTSTFVDCGYPLWEPGCDHEVSIADVGYILHGQFCRLFNASLARGDLKNQEFGEPDGYEPLIIGAVQERAPHPPGVMASHSVRKFGADISFSGSILEAGAGFQFECKNDRGAILIINSEANRKDALRKRAFKEYLIKHHKSWLELANNAHNAREITLSDLVFVTGRDNTADWATAIFMERSISGGVSFQAGYPVLAGAQFSVWGSWKQASSIRSHCGPPISRTNGNIPNTGSTDEALRQTCAAELEEYNQCVFLRGLRVLDRREYTRRKLSLKVSNSSDGLTEVKKPWFSRSSSTSTLSSSASSLNKGDPSSEGSSQSRQNSLLVNSPVDDNQVTKQIMPYRRDRAPIEALLEYMLEKSNATIVVAHDDDLAQILKDSKMNDEQATDFDKLIWSASVPVHVDSAGVGTLQRYPSPPQTQKLGSSHAPLSSPNYSDYTPTTSQNVTPRLRARGLPTGNEYPSQTSPVSEIPVQSSAQPRRSSTRKASTSPTEASYHAEQELIRGDIDTLRARLAIVQQKISLTTKTGRAAERREALRAELDVLRDRQVTHGTDQVATSVEFKNVQEQIRQKVRDLQSLEKKLPAKTTGDIDAQIRALELRVETSALTLREEKDVLDRIRSLRRSRKAVENAQALQTEIDACRVRADTLQKKLNLLPVATATRMDAVREELETMRRESEAAFSERGTLYSERAQLQASLSALYEQRRQAVERFRMEREEHRRKADEHRAQAAARIRAERAVQEEQQRSQAQERLLEKARIPAFAAEIRDCRSLLEYFSSAEKNDSTLPSSSSVAPVAEMTHKLRRPVENHPEAWEGWVPLKKNTEDSYFVGDKGKGKKGQRKAATLPIARSSKVNVPIGVLSTLLSLSIDPPAVTADVSKTVEELHRKIEWYEANQVRATEENVARTTADLQRISKPMQRTPISTT